MEEKGIILLDEEYLMSKIYIIRGVQVMLDFDLAAIYGYETRFFTRQVNNNIERFEQDFRFQLTKEEFKNLMCKNFTSRWGGTRKMPYAFTEEGIYMLMTVLKGELAVSQSKKLIKLFKQMKDYIIQRQHVLPTKELLALTTQTQNNTEEIRQIKQQVNDLTFVINDFTDKNIKDGGKRVSSISRVEDTVLYQNIVGSLEGSPVLQL